MRLKGIALALCMVAASAVAREIAVEVLPSLQQPVSNNAVTLVAGENGPYLYSFLGIGSGKTWRDITSAGWLLKPGAEAWEKLPSASGGAGRLAASAVNVGNDAWLIGGYTVAEDGSEKSLPGVYRIRVGEPGLQRVTEMPVAVEDSVALVYRDRYIYLVSGWHDLGNVNLVQVLDTKTMQWAQATPWPGTPVFGHAGGLSKDRMLVCDGVMIKYSSLDQPREFLPSDRCWAGKIEATDHRRIHWYPVVPHPGAGRYRMAATADDNDRVVFAGGSENPYNFNGVGYDGVPSKAEKSVFSYRFDSGEWQQHGELPGGTMDHRGLLHSKGWYYLIGGMRDPQRVVADVYRFRLGGASGR